MKPAGRDAALGFLDGFGLGGLKLVRNRGETGGLLTPSLSRNEGFIDGFVEKCHFFDNSKKNAIQ